MDKYIVGGGGGWDVAQLVEHQTFMPLMQVQFPGAARDFFSQESTFSADSLLVSLHPRVKSHALTSVHTLKILLSMSEFGGLWQLKHTQHSPQRQK